MSSASGTYVYRNRNEGFYLLQANAWQLIGNITWQNGANGIYVKDSADVVVDHYLSWREPVAVFVVGGSNSVTMTHMKLYGDGLKLGLSSNVFPASGSYDNICITRSNGAPDDGIWLKGSTPNSNNTFGATAGVSVIMNTDPGLSSVRNTDANGVEVTTQNGNSVPHLYVFPVVPGIPTAPPNLTWVTLTPTQPQFCKHPGF